MIEKVIKDYTLKSSIGQGGMAIVYLAEHNTLHQPVAIKVLNKEFVHNDNIRKRFLSEARNIFKMSHPNIIKVTDLIDEGDTVAFVMEYMEGQTLKEYLDTKGKLNDDEIKKLFVQMLDAVGYVHEQGLIHRDIKPSNFMISSKGVVKLLDFGIAKNTDQSSAEYTQTGTTQNMGTPMYMSPEQIKSTKDVTAQSDIYSLGVVLWQIVMGVKPYDTTTLSTFDLQLKIVNEKLVLTNTLFDAIIEIATAKELGKRYIKCDEIKAELEKLKKLDSESEKTYLIEDLDKNGVVETEDKTIFESLDNKDLSEADQKIVATSKVENNWKAVRLVCIISAIIGLYNHSYWFFNVGLLSSSYITLLILTLISIYLIFGWQRRNVNFNHIIILVSGGLILIAISLYNGVIPFGWDISSSSLKEILEFTGRWLFWMINPPFSLMKINYLLYYFSLISLVITPLFLKKKNPNQEKNN